MIDLKCMQCGSFADFSGILHCPECKSKTMTYPLRDLVQALISLSQVQCELLKDIEQRLVLSHREIERLNNKIDMLDNEDENEIPEITN